MKTLAVFDTEIFRNYFLLAIRVLDTGKVYTFERYEGHDFDVDGCKNLLRRLTVIGFNSKNFDELILALALSGASPKLMKEAANAIIIYGEKPYRLFSQYGVKPLTWMDHVDLIEVAPGQASLKIYNGRFHGKRMQDLPFPHDATLSIEDMAVVKDYCVNDLDSTNLLFDKVEERVDLRAKMSEIYGVDLRSKSDAQVAEAVIKHELQARGVDVHVPRIAEGTTYFYDVPLYVDFKTPVLRKIVENLRTTALRVGGNGEIEFPAWIVKEPIVIGDMTYQMGKGGLHSTEKSCHHLADDDTILADRDVTSYYPAIILNLGLYPKHLGKDFLDIYRILVEERVAAKKAKNKVKAESLKITVNGTFGKLGSKYSILYSPDLMLQVTLTGQLSLLLLIEWMEAAGIRVVSANTDGVVMKFSKAQKPIYEAIVAKWEKATGFNTEETLYSGVWSRDVNNYMALKPSGEWKMKGAYAETGFQKTPANEICNDAVAEYLKSGKPISETIRDCRDIRKFVTVRTVTGGAEYFEPEWGLRMPIGKAIRWYYSVDSSGPIFAARDGSKVPKSDGAIPCMELPDDFPVDVDYARYVAEARSILADLGIFRTFTGRQKKIALAELLRMIEVC